MNKLNTVLFIILMLLLSGKVFATTTNFKHQQEINQYQSLEEVEDLLCDDSCDDMLQDQIDSLEALDNE